MTHGWKESEALNQLLIIDTKSHHNKIMPNVILQRFPHTHTQAVQSHTYRWEEDVVIEKVIVLLLCVIIPELSWEESITNQKRKIKKSTTFWKAGIIKRLLKGWYY